MIVRNEAAIIERALRSALGTVDCCVICDTGSTDSTVAVVREFCARHDLPCEVHEFPFVDFGQARNEALDRARRSTLAFDYLLLFDADMELVVEDASALDDLGAEGALLRQVSVSLAYDNLRLLRRAADARYVGATHEALAVAGEKSSGSTGCISSTTPTAPIARTSSRAMRACCAPRWRGTRPIRGRCSTWRRRCATPVATPRRSTGTRGASTPAAGTRNAGTRATRWPPAGWRWAMTPASSPIASTPTPRRPTPRRAAGPPGLPLRPGTAGTTRRCCCWSRRRQLPQPREDRLFVERDAYGDAVREAIAISGFYSALPTRREAGRRACEALAVDAEAAPRRRAHRARQPALLRAAPRDQLPVDALHAIDVVLPEPFVATNPSFVRDGTGYLGVVRGVNYRIDDGRYRILDADERVRTQQFPAAPRRRLRRSSTSTRCATSRRCRGTPVARILGFEDCRLFRWRDGWWCSATARDLDAGRDRTDGPAAPRRRRRHRGSARVARLRRRPAPEELDAAASTSACVSSTASARPSSSTPAPRTGASSSMRASTPASPSTTGAAARSCCRGPAVT